MLTGPDHLSAIATLSANVGSCPQAFVLGVKWGFGHSTGLLVVALILIVATRNNNQDETIEVPDVATKFFESLVGVFMILLGTWGIRRAFLKRAKIYDAVPYGNHDEEQGSNEDGRYPSSINFVSAEESCPDDSADCIAGHDPGQGSCLNDTEATDTSDETVDERESLPTSQLEGCCSSFVSNVSTRTLAFCAGIIHGLAGPGGILGVSDRSIS